MKKKFSYFLLMGTALAAGLFWLNFTPEEPGEPKKNAPAPALAPSPAPAPAPARPATSAEALAREEKRLAALQAEYAELEQARGALRRQLGKLKARLWKARLPAAQARALTKQMRAGHALLKAPPLLGAFRDVEAMRRETAKVNSVAGKLRELEAAILPPP